MERQIRFCTTSEGVRVAYLVAGDGPPIVFPAWLYGHLDVMWDYAPARTFFETLAEDFSIVCYDKPGTGLSDRDHPALSLDSQVRALTAVVDQLSLARFGLFGFSGVGGQTAIRYAAEHPGRVAQLILYATTARRPLPQDPVQDAAVWEATKALIKAHWGLGSSAAIEQTCPNADALTRDWLARNMRESATPDMVVAMIEAFATADVTPCLPRVQPPTFVMHRRGDRSIPFEQGRAVAAGIPHARFLPLDGSWHAFNQGEDQDVLRATTAYLEEPMIAARFTEATEPAYPDGLSEREVQVLRLIAAGKSNRDIAAWLVLSPHTVVRHVSNIFDKTGVANRAEAATYAVRHGLVE